MLIYPSILPENGRAFNVISSRAYNPQNDIVLSVEYCISGNANSEAGISFFIHSDSSFQGGISGADLCYSGSLSGVSTGINNAIACIGIDSTGAFGLSAGNLSYIWRDGFAEVDIIPNSVIGRAGKTENYAMSTYGNYYRAISSFNIIGNDSRPKALRFRLGNVARTLYLDYKSDFNKSYKNIAAFDIGNALGVTDSSDDFYKISIGFTTPVSSSNSNATANFYFRSIHIEGLVLSLTSARPLLEVWENIFEAWPDVNESWSF